MTMQPVPTPTGAQGWQVVVNNEVLRAPLSGTQIGFVRPEHADLRRRRPCLIFHRAQLQICPPASSVAGPRGDRIDHVGTVGSTKAALHQA